MIPLSRLAGLAAVTLAGAPVAAQTQSPPTDAAAPAPAASCTPEHAAMGHCTMPAAEPAIPAAPTCTPEHAAMGHCTMPAAKPAMPAASACTPEHAAMGHCTMPAAKPAMPAASACTPEHAAMGHCTMPAAKPAMPAASACTPEHAAMGHCTMTPAAIEGTDLPAGSGAPPPVPADHAADPIYGPGAMAMGRHHLARHHGGETFSMVMFNLAEAKIRKGRDAYEWDGEFWYGGDLDRFVAKSEGEGAFGEGIESAEVQALYSRAVGPYFDLQAGVRYDIKPNPSRVYATVGFEGLAPGFFDVEGALFLSNRGELMGRLEGYYDQRITQKLILQPRAEFNFAAQNSPAIGVGAGLSDGEIGMRLRYDLAREFSPYVGVQYERAFGRTADYLRDAGEKVGGWSLLAGVRFWL